MSDYLGQDLAVDLHGMSVLGLAHIGDAVFELLVRTWLCTHGASTAKSLHRGATEFVTAKAQAAAAERMLPKLSGEELAVFKRGRNAHVSPAPRKATSGEYHTATGVEALFGFLYLSRRMERLDELFGLIVDSGKD